MQTESEYRPLGPITKKAMIVNDVSKFKKELKYISGKDTILAGNLSCESLKETTKDVAEEEEAQVHIVQEKPQTISAKMRQQKIPVRWGLQDTLLKDSYKKRSDSNRC